MLEPLQDADAPEVLKERCEYIYRRILPAVGATAVLSLLLSAFLWPSSPVELILFWQTAILLIAAGYWAPARGYQRSVGDGQRPQPGIRMVPPVAAWQVARSKRRALRRQHASRDPEHTSD